MKSACTCPRAPSTVFLAPNGAGKTTALRLILRLLTMQQRQISIFGQCLDTYRIAILAKVGSMIESPSSYDHLSARENLDGLQRRARNPRRRSGLKRAMTHGRWQ